MSDGEERRLIERLKRRDEAAFDELVRAYEGRIYRLVLRMMGERAEAEDLAQEVFVTVFRSIHTFRGDSKLSTWLYRVATNHCRNRIKYLNRRARGQKQPFDDVEEREEAGARGGTSAHLPGPEAMAEGRQAERVIQRALASLGDEHRELIVLRDVEGLSYEEIQQITGLLEGTVKSKLHRARLSLQKKVAELYGGHPIGGGR